MPGIFTKVDQPRVSSEITRQIERLILDGVLRPGDRLPPERDLADRFAVSRPTLREALGQLEASGLLVARQGGGTFVADVMRSVFGEPIVGLFARHEKATQDYLEFRSVMEGQAASWAAQRATDADREILTRLMASMEAAHGEADAREEARIDTEFHIAVSDASHNIVLIQTLRSIYNLLRHGVFYNRDQLYAQAGGRDALLAQHRAIHDAIMARDPARAGRAASDHIEFVRQALQESSAAGRRNATAAKRLERLEAEARSRTRR